MFSRVLCFDLNRVNAITSLSFGLATPLVKANYDKDSHCISVVYSISHCRRVMSGLRIHLIKGLFSIGRSSVIKL